MKKKIYLKIGMGKNGHLNYNITKTKSFNPLKEPWGDAIPTIVVALNLELDEKMFTEAQKELDLKIQNPEIAKDVEIDEEKSK